MSAYSIPPLVSSILFFSLGLFCYFKNKKSKVNISFALMCLTTVWWQGSWAVLFNIKDPSIVSILVRFGYIGITFIPITFYHFTIEFLNRQKEKKLVWLSYLIGAFLVIMLWSTDLYIRGYYVFYWGYYPKAGLLLHPFYLIMLSIQALRMLYLLYINLKNKLLDPIKRNQIKYMFWAIFFYSFASADFADNYGLEIYPLGFIPILIFMAIIGHTIAKYRLLDINFVIKKIIAYAGVILLLAGFVTGAYLLPLSENIKLLLYFATASVFTVLSPKIIAKTESAVNNILYKGKYDYIEKLENFIDKMVIIPKEEDLLKQTVQTLSEVFGVKKVGLFIHDQVSNSYPVKAQISLDGIGKYRIHNERGIAHWLKEHKEIFIKEETEKVLSEEELKQTNKILEDLEATVCIPAVLEENLIAIITLSKKTSGDMYSHIDTRILHRLGTQLAVTLNHIWTVAELQEERQQVEITKNRLNAITTMSHGLADRIRNDLQSIYAFLGDLPEKIKESKEKLPANVIESLENHYKASQGGVDKLIKLAIEIASICKPMSKNPQRYDPKVIIEIADEAEKELESEIQNKEIRIEKVITGTPPAVYFDKEAIKRVLWNLIQNSMHAIPDARKGLIKITVTGPVKRNEIEFLRIIVEDNGVGIPAENLENIFNPFFTTKGTAGGLGLGLTICQFIISQHEGTIGVLHAELDKGATIYVDLPVIKEPPKPTMDYKNILGMFPARRVK